MSSRRTYLGTVEPRTSRKILFFERLEERSLLSADFIVPWYDFAGHHFESGYEESYAYLASTNAGTSQKQDSYSPFDITFSKGPRSQSSFSAWYDQPPDGESGSMPTPNFDTFESPQTYIFLIPVTYSKTTATVSNLAGTSDRQSTSLSNLSQSDLHRSLESETMKSGSVASYVAAMRVLEMTPAATSLVSSRSEPTNRASTLGVPLINSQTMSTESASRIQTSSILKMEDVLRTDSVNRVASLRSALMTTQSDSANVIGQDRNEDDCLSKESSVQDGLDGLEAMIDQIAKDRMAQRRLLTQTQANGSKVSSSTSNPKYWQSNEHAYLKQFNHGAVLLNTSTTNNLASVKPKLHDHFNRNIENRAAAIAWSAAIGFTQHLEVAGDKAPSASTKPATAAPANTNRIAAGGILLGLMSVTIQRLRSTSKNTTNESDINLNPVVDLAKDP